MEAATATLRLLSRVQPSEDVASKLRELSGDEPRRMRRTSEDIDGNVRSSCDSPKTECSAAAPNAGRRAIIRGTPMAGEICSRRRELVRLPSTCAAVLARERPATGTVAARPDFSRRCVRSIQMSNGTVRNGSTDITSPSSVTPPRPAESDGGGDARDEERDPGDAVHPPGDGHTERRSLQRVLDHKRGEQGEPAERLDDRGRAERDADGTVESTRSHGVDPRTSAPSGISWSAGLRMKNDRMTGASEMIAAMRNAACVPDAPASAGSSPCCSPVCRRLE